jgi:type III pantothenate kinase
MNLLVTDIGNSDTVFGIWHSGDESPLVYRLETASLINDPSLLSQFLQKGFGGFRLPERVVVSSVVPAATQQVTKALAQWSKQDIKVLEKSQFEKLPLVILRPDEIGTDLVANALAAHTLSKGASVVVDFGTALSFTTIDSTGTILGVSIAPGLRTALQALTNHTAQLRTVPLQMPESALGKNTEQAIQTGILYGYDGLVRGIVSAQEKELGLDLFLIATGGLSKMIHTLEDRVNLYAPHLTLEGLKIAAQYL